MAWPPFRIAGRHSKAAVHPQKRWCHHETSTLLTRVKLGPKAAPTCLAGNESAQPLASPRSGHHLFREGRMEL